jgi:hypothetical protein
VEAEIKDNEIKKLMKWDFVEKIKDSLKTKELNTLKTETERKRGIVDVDGLKDSNFAGKKGKNIKGSFSPQGPFNVFLLFSSNPCFAPSIA